MSNYSAERTRALVDTAAGRTAPDLVLTNCRVFNVFAGELEHADVIIRNGYIAGVEKRGTAADRVSEGAAADRVREGAAADRVSEGAAADGSGETPAADACMENTAVLDLGGDIVCPGLIDGHIHIESSMMTPERFANAVVPHGTTVVVTDPHEIGNVAGTDGIRYMLECSEGLALDVFFMLPSCVPATPIDESGAELDAEALSPFYDNPRVLGLAELMNSYGTVRNDDSILKKIADAKAHGRMVDGHAPGLTGKELNAYVAAGVSSDHECSTAAEAMEKLKRGQWIMIREGTAARNLKALLPLFGRRYYERCMLVTDDKHPGDLNTFGHIDHIIRKAVKYGENAFHAVKMASYNAAVYFGLKDMGAVAPGFRADLLTVESLEDFRVKKVFKGGRLVAEDGHMTADKGYISSAGGSILPVREGAVSSAGEGCFSTGGSSDTAKKQSLREKYPRVFHSFNMEKLEPEDFEIKERGRYKRVIGLVKGEILTKDLVVPLRTADPEDDDLRNPKMDDPGMNRSGTEKTGMDIPCARNSRVEEAGTETPGTQYPETDAERDSFGVETDRDIIRLAVVERHRNTGHIGKGFIYGYGLERGAIASSIAHDSHNLIIAGTSNRDMALAADTVRKNEGGLAIVLDGKVLGELKLPIGGLMCDENAEALEIRLEELKQISRKLGVHEGIDPFMTLSFASLPVIPRLRLTTRGLVDVLTQEYVPAVF